MITEFALRSCEDMFYQCSSLNEIHVGFNTWGDTTNWVYSVATSGDFYCPAALPSIYDDSRIPVNWKVHKPYNPSKCLKFKALADNCVIALEGYKFSKDGLTWSDNSITLDIDETCYVKGDHAPAGVSKFTISANAEIVSGSIMSLLDDGIGESTEMPNRAFLGLFENNATLKAIHASLLPSTTLTSSCYAQMFRNTGIQSIPSSLLPATTLADSCYKLMFESCVYLTEIPVGLLKATTLAPYCYNRMFAITGISTVPTGFLPDTLTSETSCCKEMFHNCHLLNEIHVGFKSWPDTQNWVVGVAATGVFYGPRGLSKIYDSSHIPFGWAYVVEETGNQYGSATLLGGAKIRLRM